MSKFALFVILDEDVLDELSSYPVNRVEFGEKPVQVYKILSRDCRSDDTKEFLAMHKKPRNEMQLFIKHKSGYEWDRNISDEILEKKIISTGTSTYELQEDF